jgi:hypothetical protein
MQLHFNFLVCLFNIILSITVIVRNCAPLVVFKSPITILVLGVAVMQLGNSQYLIIYLARLTRLSIFASSNVLESKSIFIEQNLTVFDMSPCEDICIKATKYGAYIKFP